MPLSNKQKVGLFGLGLFGLLVILVFIHMFISPIFNPLIASFGAHVPWVGSAGAYRAWAPGEPNAQGGDEKCMHMWKRPPKTWNDVPCQHPSWGKLRALCKGVMSGELMLTNGKYYGDDIDGITSECSSMGAVFWRPTTGAENEIAAELLEKSAAEAIWLNPGGSKYSVHEPFDISNYYW